MTQSNIKREKKVEQKLNFSSTDTLSSWIGGKSEQLLYELTIFKIRISIWKKLN